MSTTNEEIQFKTEAEVYQYYQKDKDNNQVVIFEGVVYDVKDYMPDHPGGGELIGDLLGKKIDEDFEEAEHTKTAKKLFNDLKVVGRMGDSSTPAPPAADKKGNEQRQGIEGLDYSLNKDLGEKLNFDYSKGLIYQVYCKNWTIETYSDYINEPKHLVNPVRDLVMFDNPILEAGSKTPWWMIPIAYLPFEIFCVMNCLGSAMQTVQWISFGLFFWTFSEYFLHRFVFHGEEYWMPYVLQNNFMYAFHFNIHGIHHAFPMDKYRLVFPPVVGHMILYPLFYKPITNNFEANTAYPMLLGIVIGYQLYDLMHYFFHHADHREGSYMKKMKTYHMQHHYKYGTIGFGVSNKLWDNIFATEIKAGGNKSNQDAVIANSKYQK